MTNPLIRQGKPKIHDVILALNEADGAAVQADDPSMANWSVITKPSQLYGLHINEWVITQAASDGMGGTKLARMVAYLRNQQALTEARGFQPIPKPRST